MTEDAYKSHLDFQEKLLNFHRERQSDPRLPTGRDLPLSDLLERERQRTGVNYVPVKEGS